MTLQKAIEIADRNFNLHHNVPLAELNEAAILLIEAGKREKRFRFMHPLANEGLLPGETEE